MHMADALLAPSVAAAMYAASAVTAGMSVKKLRAEDPAEKLPTMAVMSSLVFAGQMINYTIPGTGSSGHLCGGLMLASLLGPEAGFLSMSVILAIQCLFFADGGLMALGANIWNMGFYSCFVGYHLIYRPILRSRLFSKLDPKNALRSRLILASVLGCVLTLQLGAFSVVLETACSGITELPIGAFAALMQPIHLAIGLIEGLITAAVLVFVYAARPELLPDTDRGSGRFSRKKTLAILAALALVTAGALSLAASGNPDGLEWSLFGNAEYSANMGLDEEHFGVESKTADMAAAVVEKTAILPDYGFRDDPENAAGTSVAGLIGAGIVAAAAAVLCFSGGKRKKRSFTEN